MKFGILTYSSLTPNIGDRYQIIGIKKAYEKMNIAPSDIIEIDRDYLTDYDGEYVILPITSFVDVLPGTSIFPLSERIIPVFIGFHCIDDRHISYMKEYSNYGPFGCRDMETVRRLRQIGLDAFLSGCLSLCLDQRETDEGQNKVFLVDISAELKSKIPQNILKDAIEITHEFTLSKLEHSKNQREAMEKKVADETLEMYKNEAKLIITSRLHCALPATAMGIPTIVGRKYREHRFEGVDKLLNYYPSEEYENIDWNPEPIYFEHIKEKLIDLAVEMITKAYNKYSNLCDISYFYETDNRHIYYSGIKSHYLTMEMKKKYFRNRFSHDNLLSFIRKKELNKINLFIFGSGDKGNWMARRYRKQMSLAETCFYLDNDKEKINKTLNGYQILSPKVLTKYDKNNIMIIVATDKYFEGAGYNIGKELIENYNMIEGKHFFFLDKLNESANFYLDDVATVESWADGF